jgi:putative molybdopterin biosynthesis protein
MIVRGVSMFRKLLSLEDAKSRIAEVFSPKPLGAEEVPLSEAAGRVLAEDVISPIDVPPFSRSTVDGYAVKAADTFGAEENKPAALKIVGSVAVGAVSKISVRRSETAVIVTGAPLPRGADSVVMLEDASEKAGKIFVYKAVARGENMMQQGSDIHKSEVVLKRGSIVASRESGVLAALGFVEARVFKRPKVAIVSTGAEIVEPGQPLPAGKVYDINTYTLTAATLECGGQPIGFGIVKDDDVELLKTTLRKALREADVVITSGGVSVGPKDVLPKVLNELGKPGVIVHGVAVKPGKPVAVAIVGGKPVFSLPGHPTSSLLMFHLLIRPLLLKVAGRKEEQSPMTAKALSKEKLFSARGRRTFVMVTLTRDSAGRLWASQVPKSESGAITTLAKANGYVELRETQQFVEEDEEVTVFLFKPLADSTT